MILRMGLNPYGLTYHLGLQGRGTERENKQGKGLEGFIAIALELKAQVLEIFDPWLAVLTDDELKTLKYRLDAAGMTPVVSAGLHMMGPIESALRSAKALNAKVIRLGLSPVLEGSRNAWGTKWQELLAAIDQALAQYAPLAQDLGVSLAIENHQDFTSRELVRCCEIYGPAVGITFDTGNAFPVLQSPADFAQNIAPHVKHIHFKDYRVQFTDEGYKLVRCAVGDGAVPFKAIINELSKHHETLTAVLEPGALEARHIRFFDPSWWNGYAPMDGKQVARAISAARLNRLPEDADCRTPWERNADTELVDYELAMINRSAANMRALGLMK
jgi:3-oxoisoapionate decarboxylase